MQPSPSNREAGIVRGRVLLDAAPTSSIAFVVPPVRALYGVPAACFPSFIAHGLFFRVGRGKGGCQFSTSSIQSVHIVFKSPLTNHIFFPGLLTR